MRTILLSGILVCLPGYGVIAAMPGIHDKASAVAGAMATTVAKNTTTASLIVAGVLNVAADACSVTLTDSAGNTWTAIENASNPNNNTCLFYVCGPTTSVTHTFSVTGNYASIFMQAFTGTLMSACRDVTAGAHNTGNANSSSTVQPGSVTPFDNNSLVITTICHIAASTTAIGINASFTETDDITVGGSSEGSMAYLVQGATAAVNPTWTLTGGSDNLTSAIAVFTSTSTTVVQPQPRHGVVSF